MKVVATYNIKGGVGKTSTAVNVGYLAARDGMRTLIWDLDPQGSATYLFRVKPKIKGGGKALVEGRRTLDEAIKGTDYDQLDLMPADFSYRNLDLDLDSTKRPTDRLRRLVAPLQDEYDLVILDCPPSVSLVSENVIHACDVLLVPLIPAMLSVRTFDQLIDFVDGMPGRKPRVMAFLSMVDLRKKAHREFTERLPTSASVVAEAIPNRAVIEQMAQQRAPVLEFRAAQPRDRRLRGSVGTAAVPFGRHRANSPRETRH
jgi:cellulose biosynthesis protein BcsQ